MTPFPNTINSNSSRNHEIRTVCQTRACTREQEKIRVDRILNLSSAPPKAGFSTCSVQHAIRTGHVFGLLNISGSGSGPAVWSRRNRRKPRDDNLRQPPDQNNPLSALWKDRNCSDWSGLWSFPLKKMTGREQTGGGKRIISAGSKTVFGKGFYGMFPLS